MKKVELHWSPNHTLENDYELMKIEVEIVDKEIPRTIIDDGANINIMLESIMKKLGLAITHPLLYSIRIVDQAIITPIKQSRDFRVRTEERIIR